MKIRYLLALALLAQTVCISLANAAELIQANNIGALLEKFDKQDQKKLEKELFSLLNKYKGKGYLDTSYTMGAEGVWIGRFHYNLNGHTYEINVEVIAPDQNKDVARPFREMAVVVNYLQGGAWRLAVQWRNSSSNTALSAMPTTANRTRCSRAREPAHLTCCCAPSPCAHSTTSKVRACALAARPGRAGHAR